MPDNVTTGDDSETPYPDEEDWRVAFEPFHGHPHAALHLGYHLTELKRQIGALKKHEALAALERAIDQLYEHSDFRRVSREMFSIAISGELTTDKEEALRYLGVTTI